MLKDLLSPEAQFKKMFKKRLPHLKGELCAVIESLLLQVADNTESNPFELVLILSKSKDLALGRVFNAEKKCLEKMDAGKIIKDLLSNTLNSFPEIVKDFALEKLEGEDVEQMIVESLQGRSLLIHYGENEELIFAEVTKKGKELLDVDEFISTLEL